MILDRLGFFPDTVHEFQAYFRELDTGELIFPSSVLEDFHCPLPEKVLPDTTVLTPTEFFLEFRPDDLLSRQVFLFASALELMAFWQVFKNKKPMLIPAFLAVGSRPGFEFIQKIKARCNGARFVLVNGHPFFDRIWDVRLACLLDGYEPTIRMENGKVHTNAGRFGAEISPDLLSLFRFCRLSGYRTSVRTRKAKGFNSYLEMIRPAPVFNPF
ncbi:hypothetical protein [Gaoshiqia sp. Z1-71]|uniref:hypothetical protein n=1 Tax=Gaoshiqia hydrogeniformans TaxID=3290090 RepID=UPI003BF891A7